MAALRIRKDHTVYPVGRHSDTHLVIGFAVSIIPRKEWHNGKVAESKDLKVFSV